MERDAFVELTFSPQSFVNAESQLLRQNTFTWLDERFFHLELFINKLNVQKIRYKILLTRQRRDQIVAREFCICHFIGDRASESTKLR